MLRIDDIHAKGVISQSFRLAFLRANGYGAEVIFLFGGAYDNTMDAPLKNV